MLGRQTSLALVVVMGEGVGRSKRFGVRLVEALSCAPSQPLTPVVGWSMHRGRGSKYYDQCLLPRCSVALFLVCDPLIYMEATRGSLPLLWKVAGRVSCQCLPPKDKMYFYFLGS